MILVTGHAGFLGKALMRAIRVRLSAAGTRGLSSGGRWASFGYDLPRYTILAPDPAHPAARYAIDHWVRRAEVCFHIAAMADLNDSFMDPGGNWRANVEGTINVARACAEGGCLMVYISTCCAYGAAGRKGKLETERDKTYPTEVYAWSKLLGEYALKHTKGLRYRIARIGTLYGPGMRPTLFNRIALERVGSGKPVTLHGSGRQTRTYLYIDDCTTGLLAIWRRGKDGNIYNLAGEDLSVSVAETVKVAGEVTGRDPKVVYVKDRPGQIGHEAISCGKARRVLGWKPCMGYREGMRRTWEWLQQAK